MSDQAPMQAQPIRQVPPSTKATTVFVLGLLGVVLCGILAPIAWAIGHGERNRVQAGEVAENGLLTARNAMAKLSSCQIPAHRRKRTRKLF